MSVKHTSCNFKSFSLLNSGFDIIDYQLFRKLLTLILDDWSLISIEIWTSTFVISTIYTQPLFLHYLLQVVVKDVGSANSDACKQPSSFQ